MSDNILQAIDNIQSALATLDLADGVGTAHETLQAVNANIDAIRLSIDTRSVAEVTAQNTNFSDLIAAITALACSPVVNNYVTVQGGSGCCSGSSGCEPPSVPGSEGGDPPDGWEDPPGSPPSPGYPGTSVYYDRKCKVANAIHENVTNLISNLNDTPLSQLAFPLVSGAITLSIGLLGLPALIPGVAGTLVSYVSGIGITYWSWKDGIDLAQLLLDMDAVEQDLVCALYNSSNGNDALTAYMGVLETYGTSVANRAFLEAVVVIDLVNRLYFRTDDGEEATLENYTPPLSCNCANCTNYINVGTLVSDVGGTIEVNSEQHTDGKWYTQIWLWNDGQQSCGKYYTLSNFVLVSGTITYDGAIPKFRFYSENPPSSGSSGDVYNSNTFPAGSYNAVRWVIIKSTTEFAIRFDYVEE